MSEHDSGAVEHKYANITAIDVPGRTVSGYASTWQIDKVGDAFAREAWDEDLAQTPLESRGLFWMHDANAIPLGTITALKTDATGLWFKATVLDTPRGTELLTYLKSLLNQGIAAGVSVGYRVLQQTWRKIAEARVRIIEKAKLFEVSFTVPGLQANAGAIVLGVKAGAATDPESALYASLSATALALRATATALEEIEATKTAPTAGEAQVAAYRRQLAELDLADLAAPPDPRWRAIVEAKSWLLDQELAEARSL